MCGRYPSTKPVEVYAELFKARADQLFLGPQDYELWLDPEVHEPDKVSPLLKPYPEKEMEVYPVGFDVNSPKQDGEGLIQPLWGK